MIFFGVLLTSQWALGASPAFECYQKLKRHLVLVPEASQIKDLAGQRLLVLPGGKDNELFVYYADSLDEGFLYRTSALPKTWVSESSQASEFHVHLKIPKPTEDFYLIYQISRSGDQKFVDVQNVLSLDRDTKDFSPMLPVAHSSESAHRALMEDLITMFDHIDVNWGRQYHILNLSTGFHSDRDDRKVLPTLSIEGAQQILIRTCEKTPGFIETLTSLNASRGAHHETPQDVAH
jgi:hypothetical protein